MNRSTAFVVFLTMSTTGPGDAARVERVGVEGHVREAALVQQHDDRLHAVAALELTRVAVGGRGLVEEREVRDARRRDDARRPLERHADEPDLLALEATDRVGLEERLGVELVDHVGGQVAELRAREAVAVLAAVGRVTAAALHALELGGALVELVVADGREVEPEQVHGLDRGLVVVERRQQRAAADQVARGDGQRVAVLALELAQVAAEDRGAARGDRRGSRPAGRGRGPDAARGRGLQVAVEVVDRQQLDLDVLRLVVVMVVALVRRGGAGEDERKHARRPQQTK